MKRFFFNLASKEDKILDTKGREFSDLASVHRHAMMLIHKMIALDDVDWRGWFINVTEANHRSVLTVLFPQAYCSSYKTSRDASDCDSAADRQSN